MNTDVGHPEIGQWYERSDKGEVFQVTGLDAHSGTIEIQTFDGDIDEIDSDAWATLPLTVAEPPEDWTGPMDVDKAAVEGTDLELPPHDWSVPLPSMEAIDQSGASWQDTLDSEDTDARRGEPPKAFLKANDPAHHLRETRKRRV